MSHLYTLGEMFMSVSDLRLTSSKKDKKWPLGKGKTYAIGALVDVMHDAVPSRSSRWVTGAAPTATVHLPFTPPVGALDPGPSFLQLKEHCE